MKPITPEQIQKVCDELALTLIQKNTDYGNSFQEQFKEYGLDSVCIRLDDKLRRLKTLRTLPPKVATESRKDTLFDGAGYNILGYLCLVLEEEEKRKPNMNFEDIPKIPPNRERD